MQPAGPFERGGSAPQSRVIRTSVRPIRTLLSSETTVLQGNAAEAAVLRAFAGAGFYVLLPFGDGLPFDLGVALPGGEILRIQVKTGRVRHGCVEFNSASTDHGRGQQHYRGRADLIAVYVPVLDQVFILPVNDCPISRGFLRLEPARNNQRRGVRRAEDYSFEAWARSVPRW